MVGAAMLVTAGCGGVSQPETAARAPQGKAAAARPAEPAKTTASKPVLAKAEAARGAAPAASAEPIAAPRLVLEDSAFNFGVMSPRELRSHTFHFRNEGQAPLEIKDGATNCKCVSHKLARRVIQPGERGELQLTWRGGEIEKERLTARVRMETNDPELEVVEFSAFGRVANQISLAPSELKATDVKPGEQLTLSTLVASHLWSDFSLSVEETPRKDILAECVALSPAEAEEAGVRSGWRLSVTAPSTCTSEGFEGHVQVVAASQADGDEGTDKRTLRIPLSWELRQAVALSGPGVDEQGGIHLGSLGREPANKRFLLKVSDEQPKLTVVSQNVSPAFLQVKLEPYRMSEHAGLYRLEIVTPAAGLAPGVVEGSLRLEFDHPRIKAFEAPIEIGQSI